MTRLIDSTLEPVSGTHKRVRMSSLPPKREHSPAQNASIAAATDILRLVDELEQDATGALVFGENAEDGGAILIEKGKICWGIAPGLSHRLTDILRHQSTPTLPVDQVESIVSKCQTTRQPIGEALVEAGLITPQGLRSGLKQQSAEAVALIASLGRKGRFLPHRRQTYDPTYCFSTTEVLGALGCLRGGDETMLARTMLRQVVQGIAAGAVFSRTGGSTLLLGVEEYGVRLSVEQISEMSVWAQGQLDVAEAVAPGLKLVSSTAAGGQAIVAWQDGELMFVAFCENTKALARVLMAASRR